MGLMIEIGNVPVRGLTWHLVLTGAEKLAFAGNQTIDLSFHLLSDMLHDWFFLFPFFQFL